MTSKAANSVDEFLVKPYCCGHKKLFDVNSFQSVMQGLMAPIANRHIINKIFVEF